MGYEVLGVLLAVNAAIAVVGALVYVKLRLAGNACDR